MVAFTLHAVRWVDGADLLELRRRRAPHCLSFPTVSASAAASATAAAVAAAPSAAARPSPLPLPLALTSSAGVSLHHRAPSCPVRATGAATAGATTAIPTHANTHSTAIIINSKPICAAAVPATNPADGAHMDGALAAYEYAHSNGARAQVPSGNEHTDERSARRAQVELVQGFTYPTVATRLATRTPIHALSRSGPAPRHWIDRMRLQFPRRLALKTQRPHSAKRSAALRTQIPTIANRFQHVV